MYKINIYYMKNSIMILFLYDDIKHFLKKKQIINQKWRIIDILYKMIILNILKIKMKINEFNIMNLLKLTLKHFLFNIRIVLQ